LQDIAHLMRTSWEGSGTALSARATGLVAVAAIDTVEYRAYL